MAWKLPLFTKQDKKVKIGKDSTVNHKGKDSYGCNMWGIQKTKKLEDMAS